MLFSVQQLIAAALCLGMVFYIVRYFCALKANEETPGVNQKTPVFNPNDDLVTIATFDLAFDAECAKSVLEANAIHAFVMDTAVISLNQTLTWAAGGVRLQVPLKHASLAQSVLSESGFTALIDIRNHHHCPDCQSTNITCRGLTKWQMALAVLFLGALLLFLKRDFHCNDCQLKWSS